MAEESPEEKLSVSGCWRVEIKILFPSNFLYVFVIVYSDFIKYTIITFIVGILKVISRCIIVYLQCPGTSQTVH